MSLVTLHWLQSIGVIHIMLHHLSITFHPTAARHLQLLQAVWALHLHLELQHLDGIPISKYVIKHPDFTWFYHVLPSFCTNLAGMIQKKSKIGIILPRPSPKACGKRSWPGSFPKNRPNQTVIPAGSQSSKDHTRPKGLSYQREKLRAAKGNRNPNGWRLRGNKYDGEIWQVMVYGLVLGLPWEPSLGLLHVVATTTFGVTQRNSLCPNVTFTYLSDPFNVFPVSLKHPPFQSAYRNPATHPLSNLSFGSPGKVSDDMVQANEQCSCKVSRSWSEISRPKSCLKRAAPDARWTPRIMATIQADVTPCLIAMCHDVSWLAHVQPSFWIVSPSLTANDWWLTHG